MKSLTASPPRPLLTVTEACQLLGLGQASIYRLIDRGLLTRRKLGSRATRITRASVEKFLADVEAGVPVVIRETSQAERQRHAQDRAARRAASEAVGG